MSQTGATSELRGLSPADAVVAPASWGDLATLVEEHHATLYRYAYRLSGTSADAEDLTQQVFLVAQQKLDQVREASSVRGWLFTVLRNCYLRSKRRPTPITATGLAVDLDHLPAAIAEDDIDREQLQAAINDLPDEFKLVVLMFYFEDCSYREIAERLEIPVGTVMSRLARAKGHLRGRLIAETAAETISEQKRPSRPAKVS